MNPFEITTAPTINHEERRKRIGASEVPAIMGTCDFNNAYGLWELKTGKKDPFLGNWATRRGNDLEPVVRELYERKYDVEAYPVFKQLDAWPTLTASLDGFTGSTVVEIKVPSKEKHQLAINGIVPTTYRDQVQAQMLCAGVNIAHYVSYSTDDDQIAVVEVMADKVRQAEILKACKAFWAMVESNTPPDGGEVEQPELETIFWSIDQVREKIKDLENEEKTYVEKIKQMMKADKIKCGKFKAYWSTRKGNVKYADIPELKGLDLEKYRGPDTRVFTVK
jgi:putative phage-type endonuclease